LPVINCNGKILDLSVPRVMGILNLTPDSFYDGGRYLSIDAQLEQAGNMLGEGASVIDIGAVSTRPGAKEVCQTGELERILPSIRAIRHNFPGAIISVDTYRPLIARAAVDQGADMINDIYAGRFQEGMMETVASLGVPYIMMHMKGTPENMQDKPSYSDILAEITYFFEKQVAAAMSKGIRDIIVDPGFGFGKTIEHNYQLLDSLDSLHSLGLPIMAGISRKSIICKVLGTEPVNSLNGTSILHTIALMKGVSLLRCHDVKEAMEAIKLVTILKENSTER
jgi:dihydropteroate synthase